MKCYLKIISFVMLVGISGLDAKTVSQAEFITMVRVDGGTFSMGKDRIAAPVHTVTLSSFSIGRTEVTVGQFRRFVKETHYVTSAETAGGGNVVVKGQWMKRADANWKNLYFLQLDTNPVLFVSWNDAVNFCNWLSRSEGLTPAYEINGTDVSLAPDSNGYRLPTEAQWEFACRGGVKASETTYSGSEKAEDVGWSMDNSKWESHPVARLKPNSLGLYDMSGNAAELCQDWFGPYSSADQTDPTGAEAGESKVARGGSFASPANQLTVYGRLVLAPGYGSCIAGFRVVKP
jgi:formylglycine-generating enzyme required for sulfatase activity